MIKERDVAIASRKKLIELQSKGGINYKFNDQLVSVITTPNCKGFSTLVKTIVAIAFFFL